ncbi:two-component system response regulator [Staphylococcus saprophyticus]|jgi:two-component system response regulator protein GraR|uniref:response regulator transcription factor n=1 Tax=Staphylococcus TaxID=1279 RepID=UPI0006604BC2|nr:response regulator transcription factor [Staphylococcus saprophyticus]SIN56948.1 two component response transcriptional regulatory protein MprA [Mycobacteroides abscessus subsp. abscessus]AMG18789.1 DNA-binding response regulator [Staphylococcus saprophyticus]AMG34179.1 DNA-binding response regulator [Staphylococcus saprophyticus]ASE57811.1 DNA-binding response regulator [Staphylococcus saprophyticus]MBC2921397.1 response regulator transcription factor [Staphylococcus saprophyticus]
MDILLVEDDMTLFKELSEELEQWDFNVNGIDDFNDVMTKFESVNPAIVIMDVKLPKYDGFYWTRKIREVSNTPILFLSSRDNPMDQVMSMELGADDYVQKPFNTNVLIAKLQAIYRRVYQFSLDEKRVLSWQDAILDLSKDSINKEDHQIYLSKTEMIILEMLVKKQDQIVTRDTLITALWDDEAFVSDNTLTVNVNRLRKKLADIDMNDAIETKIGKGYMAHG